MNHINWDIIDDNIEEFNLNGQIRVGKIVNIYHNYLVVAFPIFKKVYNDLTGLDFNENEELEHNFSNIKLYYEVSAQ